MKEALKTIPELFYDLLANLIPGFVTLEFVAISPIVQQNFADWDISSLPVVDRTLFSILGGYLIGQFLTTVSDIFVRRPVWLVFGETSINLLGDGTALIKPLPKPLDPDLASALKLEIERALSIEFTNLKAHSLLDMCEQYVKKYDYEAGMLCQKRHALVVLSRNMIIGLLILLPCYWSIGLKAHLLILFAALVFFVRWNYLRIRRAEFLYHCFHNTYLATQKLQARN